MSQLDTANATLAAAGQLLSGIAAVGLLWHSIRSKRKESKIPDELATSAKKHSLRARSAMDGFLGCLVVVAFCTIWLFFTVRDDLPVTRSFIVTAVFAAIVICGCSFIAGSYLSDYRVEKKKANQALEPTAPSGRGSS